MNYLILTFIFAVHFLPSSQAKARDYKAPLKQVVLEEYGLGDDGMECKVTLKDLVELSKNQKRFLNPRDNLLLQFYVEQNYEQHGCQLRYQCYALMEKAQEENWYVYWLNCKDS